MKQSSWPSWAILWALLPLAAAMKLVQESKTSMDGTHRFHASSGHLSNALVLRSSKASAYKANFSKDQDLDAVVSAKFISDVGNAIVSGGSAVVNVGNAIADAGATAVNTLKEAGMTIGTAVANGAQVVGRHVVRAAEVKLSSLAPAILKVANELGKVAVAVGDSVADVGEMVAETTVHLAGAALERAKRGVNQGVKMASKVGDAIANKVQELGEEVAKLGPLVAGLAKDVWEGIKDFLKCLGDALSLCSILIGDICDCSNDKSYIRISNGLEMRCLYKVTGFGTGFGVTASSGSPFGVKAANGRIILPGNEFSQGHRKKGEPLRSRRALRLKSSKAPRGSCETSLELALEGVVQYAPDMTITLKTNGDTKFAITGLVRASMDVFVKAEGGCAFTAEKRFPKKPLKKIICGTGFCLLIALQMVAELEMKGTLTGTLETSASVDFDVSGTVSISPSGKADVSFNSPSITHQDGFAMGASASASVRVGAGPVLMAPRAEGLGV
ncbi:unnamed protein product [Symbiodinium natans]|uniref:Uncharacterized protein n=1 Tax=Symbiodinium natans TaxID=878477 RepID=A0A812PIT5_9DINO|nr:unnamed protein product [Symbiodinium natans]